MFAEACPGNPSRVKQQAGVREVSFSLLHCCHHYHDHLCDRLINIRLRCTLKDDIALKTLENKQTNKLNFRSLWEGCAAVVYIFRLPWRLWLGF